jgi:KTSC domain
MRNPLRHRVVFTLLCCVCVHGASLFAAAPSSDKPRRTTLPARIDRLPVESTSLASMGFAKEARVLEIEFRSGAIYRYFDVPQNVFEELKRAQSIGRYFAQSIRGKYEFQRVARDSK